MASSSTVAYQRGVADRQRYETWYHGLSGDYLNGASYWAANRSVAGHAQCEGFGSPGATGNWIAGCRDAQSRLTVPDRLRHGSSDYRLGWNSIPNDPPVTVRTTSEAPVASTTASPSPPSAAAPAAPAEEPTTAATQQTSLSSGVAGWAIGAIVLGLVLFSLGLALYFLPTLVAIGRRKRNTLAIFALNLFLGWTVLGWVLSLIWSLSVDPRPV
jgi:hypothetical protein